MQVSLPARDCTQKELGDRIYRSQTWVSLFEADCLLGKSIRIDDLERYLDGLGFDLEINIKERVCEVVRD